MYTILAADIGATNCRFALFQAEPDDPARPVLALLRERWLPAAEYAEFRHVLRFLCEAGSNAFLPGKNDTPALAVLAPAGPVQGDSCRVSNLPWLIRSSDVQAELGIQDVFLLNDFAAQAYSCLLPEQIEAVPLLPGTPVPGAPLAVAGAGTGFGQALLLDAGEDVPGARSASASKAALLSRLRRAQVLPSEGGHCDFPFTGKEEFAFAEFVRQSAGIDRVVGDTLASGSGLAHIFAFLTGERLSPAEVTGRIDSCPQALEWFARFYGRICRNYVLSTLALGGLFITGGMALRVPALSHPAFAREFHLSAGQGELLRAVPVHHIRNPQAGLWGAALYGLLHM